MSQEFKLDPRYLDSTKYVEEQIKHKERLFRHMRDSIATALEAVLIEPDPEARARQFIKRLLELEQEKLPEVYAHLRVSGAENNTCCENGCGIILYVTNEGKKALLGKGFSEADFGSYKPGVSWVLTIPQGTYMTGPGGMQFYKSYDTNLKQLQEPFTLPYRDLVRIEGNDNSLWQNNTLQLDGNPKPKKKRWDN